MFQVFIAAGIIFAYALGSVADYIELNFMCAILSVMHVVATVFSMPESPYFLLHKNKDDLAKEAMMKLRDGEDLANVESELVDIKVQVVTMKSVTLANDTSGSIDHLSFK